MLLTMEEIKAQLRLDEDFDADDRHLQLLACAAQKRTETYLNRKLYAPDETIPDSDPDGLHLPERLAGRLPRIRARRPLWLLTAAAHSRTALHRAGRFGADAAVLSPIFPSRSPSAGEPLGPMRAALWLGGAPLPVYVLGGVGAATAPRLARTGAVGLAAVEALLAPEKPPS